MKYKYRNMHEFDKVEICIGEKSYVILSPLVKPEKNNFRKVNPTTKPK